MIALFFNSILNTFLSGRVRLILGNFGFRKATFEPEMNLRTLIYLLELFTYITLYTTTIDKLASTLFVHFYDTFMESSTT